MLLQIRNYLAKKGIASNQQIAREFSLDILALQPMLDMLVQKGCFAFCQETRKCQLKCLKCTSQPPVYYQYQG